MYVYIKSEASLYTVGFYDPEGAWVPESDHKHSEDAAERVHYLNGGDFKERITIKVDPKPRLSPRAFVKAAR